MSERLFPLLDAVRQHGNRCAYRDADGEATYRQFARDVDAHAAWLAAHGWQAGQRIAWCPGNDYESMVRFWAIVRGGFVACPISHRLPRPRRLQLAAAIHAEWIDRWESVTAGFVRDEIDFAAPATIVFSSGSSGEPKGVVHSLDAHIASALGATARIPLQPGDAWMWGLPVSHVGGLSILFRCALAGATVVGMRSANDRSQAPSLNECVRTMRLTHMSLVPTQLWRLLRDGVDWTGLKSVLVGGQPLPASLFQHARKAGVPLQTTYGLTEMASQVTTSDSLPDSAERSGFILPHRELCIGPRHEILVRGKTMCLGYVSEAGIKPVVDEAGWFHTGDRGTLHADGQLEVWGRQDNMFISGGENIYPERIERELLQFVGVRRAVVVPRRDAEFGDRPVAFVEADQVDRHGWSDKLRERLAGFEIPTEYLSWPQDVELAIKPNRRQLKKIANEMS